MTKRASKFSRGVCLLNVVLLLAVPGCQPQADFAAFFQDFAREALAAFLL